MAEFVGTAAIEMIKCMAEPITRQLKYLCCFNTNIQDLKDEATKLDEAKVGVEGQVDAARRNVQVILPQVQTWLRDVTKIQADMTQIDTEILNVKSRCLAIKSRFSLSRKATKMAAHMKELQDDHAKFGPISHPPPPAASASIPLGQTCELQSRKHFEEEIMATLREKKVSMMGICGMGGVGKTTMAKKIMSRARGEGLFHEMVMVVVSQPVDMLRIQREMAELLGLKLEVDSVGARAHLLHARLMNTKSILIILDDLWKPLNLEELGIPELKKGCTILLTSRDTDVFSAMNVEKRFQMKTLEAEEAWSLFREKVGSCADDQILFPIAQQIVGECNGLPIALVTVGVALKDKKNKAKWEDALEQIRHCYPEGIPDFLAQVYKPLKLSYDLLENKRAESIFLLCCLFPEDCDIPISDLHLYAWGLGMLKGITSLRAAWNNVQASVDTLKSRSLLLDGSDDEHAKMHDVVRDVGIFIAAKEGLINPNFSWGREESCTWISLFEAHKITLPGGSVFPDLRLLLFEWGWEAELPLCDNFFENARELHVLSILRYVNLRSLPLTIQFQKNLRTLILKDCPKLEDISVVGELESLEILFCFVSSIKELPEEIGRLSQLKLLYVCGGLYMTIGAGIISRLTRLEELTLIASFSKWEWGASEGKNARLCELNSLSSLTTLTIQIKDASLAAEQIHLSSNLEEFDITIGIQGRRSTTSYQRWMSLELESEIIIGDWIQKLLEITEGLFLTGDGSTKLVPLLPKYQRLKDLCLKDAKMTTLIDGRSRGTTTVFPSLEFLELEGIDDLEEIHKGPISSDSFNNLKEITLCRLPKLQHLWNAGKDHLLRLKSLTIDDCLMLEQIVMWDEQGAGQSSHNDCRIMRFPELETLELCDLPRLTSFCKGIDSIGFPLLTRMEIVKCPNLKSLVSSKENDDSLHLFCKSDQAAFCRLDKLEIGGYDNVSSLWCDHIPIDFFPQLESLFLSDCGNIKSLFSLSIATKLDNLRTLTIEGCGEMVKVMEDKMDEVERCPFINLRELTLVDLPKLKAFCDWRCAPELPSLRKMIIHSCDQMERFLSGSITSPISSDFFKNLHTLKIRSCSMFEQVVSWNEGENGAQSSCITFPELRDLFLHNLPRLTSFCKGIQSIEFPRLTHMGIDKCPNLKSLVSSTNDDSLHLFCKSDRAAFRRLEELEIGGYDNVSSVWCDHIPIDFFPQLGDLFLFDCGNIKSLFSLSIATKLDNLRRLTIEGCGEMVKVIEDKVDEVERCPFINLRELYLFDLPKLKAFCDWRCAPELPSLRKMHIRNCTEMERFSSGSSITSPISSDSFKNLHSIEIESCSMLEQVLLWNEEESGHRRITFPKLDYVSLRNLPRLTSFCKGIQSIEFPLVTRMKIVKCPNLKTLVSSKENDEKCSSHLCCKSHEAAFGRLKTLEIDGYDNIISLWCGQIPIDFFTGLEVLSVINCGNIKTLISPSIARNLRELSIESCGDLVKVIEDDEIESSPFLKLEKLKLKKLPKLKAFTALHELPSLREVYIDECPEMEQISSGSSLTSPISSDHSFENLGSLNIRSCSMLEQIVLWNEEEQNGHRRITFPKLEWLILCDLPRLTSFCKGIQSIEFPVLTQMAIVKCQNLRSLVSSMENDKKCSGAINHDTDNLLHLFSEEAAFGRLEELKVDGCENISSLWCDHIPIDFFTGLVKLTVSNCVNIKSLFSPSIAGNLNNLRELTIERCIEMVKVIEGEEVERSPFTKLKVLNLIQLPKLEAFCDSRCSLELPSLRKAVISECPQMERSPISSDFFKNLDFIEIRSCSMFEQVVSWNEGENGAQSSCITFPKLRRLHLHNLPRLTSFCKGIQSIEFPVLTRMEIVKCPNLKTLVSSTENDFKRCSGAINHDSDDSLHLFCKSHEAAFGRLEELKVDGCENISSLWCDHIPIDFFTGLVELTVSNCVNIKSLFSPSIAGNLDNLKELTIERCIEMVKVIEGEEVERSPFIKLKVLRLTQLPKLKAFSDWKCDIQLPSLRGVRISNCPEMERLSFGRLTAPNLDEISKKDLGIIDYTNDLNDELFWDRDSFHLEFLYGGDQ